MLSWPVIDSIFMGKFIHHKKKRIKHGTAFWDSEYKNPEHLKLSEEAGGDLMKFCRWLERRSKMTLLNATNSVIDLGCGNGRNIIYLADNYGMHGVGYDSSSAAIAEAKRLAEGRNINFTVRSMAGPLEVPDESQTLALDMMSSHFLKTGERKLLRDEIYRCLKPGGFLFMKTFLKDGDLHTKRLIEERPGSEPGSYIHPVIGVEEYVYGEEELVEFLSEKFIVHKTYASHKHVSKGKAWKRRTISVYAEKDPYE